MNPVELAATVLASCAYRSRLMLAPTVQAILGALPIMLSLPLIEEMDQIDPLPRKLVPREIFALPAQVLPD